MARVRDDLKARLCAIDGVMVSESMFGNGDAYWVNGKEIAHFEREGVIEVRLTRRVIRDHRAAFRADDRVELRPSGADWIRLRFNSHNDVVFVVDMVTTAANAHQPAPGETAKAPPTGAELRRRQRFH